MNRPIQIACALCGPLFALMLFGGMLCAGLLPPKAPSDSAQQIAHVWATHTDLRRLGLVVMLVGAGVTVPFGAMIALHLKRIEGAESPMTYIQLVGVATGMVAVALPTLIFMAAAFRPDRGAGLEWLTNDLAWIPFVVNFPPALLQCLSISVAVLADRSPEPVFPRWVGYYNAWTAFLFLPGGLIIFFKHGPFAWNGVISFWMVAVLFGAWFIVMTVMLIRATNARFAAAPPARGSAAA